MEMGGGTPCDIKDGKPRGVVIRYICDQEAYKYGSVSEIKYQTSAWVWVRVVVCMAQFLIN